MLLSSPGNKNTVSLAALMNALAALLMLLVVFGLIGITTSADSDKLAEMALTNPLPLILQDILKIFSGLTALVLIRGLYRRFRDKSPALIKWGSIFALISVLCLFVNAAVSLYLIAAASSARLPPDAVISGLRAAILVLGIGAVMLNGVWYIAVSRIALKHNSFPTSFGFLGLALGVVSFMPPLFLLGLVLSIIWTFWLGWLLWP